MYYVNCYAIFTPTCDSKMCAKHCLKTFNANNCGRQLYSERQAWIVTFGVICRWRSEIELPSPNACFRGRDRAHYETRPWVRRVQTWTSMPLPKICRQRDQTVRSKCLISWVTKIENMHKNCIASANFSMI